MVTFYIFFLLNDNDIFFSCLVTISINICVFHFSSVTSNNSSKTNSNQNSRAPFSRNNSTDTSNGIGNPRFNNSTNTTGSRFNSGTSNGGSASRFNRRDSSANNPPKRELGPVREGRCIKLSKVIEKLL